MSTSEDAPGSPDAIKAQVPSPSEVPDWLSGLCESCGKAHYAALRDDGADWEQLNDQVKMISDDELKRQDLPADEWPSLPRLLVSSQAGCAFCAFLRQSILSNTFNNALEHWAEGNIKQADPRPVDLQFSYGREWYGGRWHEGKWYGGWHSPAPRGLKQLIVIATVEERPTVFLHFEIEAIPEHQDVAKWLVLKPAALHNYEDDEIASFMKRELKKCPVSLKNEHDIAEFLPERLIDVGVNSLRLVERNGISAGLTTRPQYCALSYCWGPREDASSQTKTTSHNLPSYLQSLDFDHLSPVLKDAVKAARCLEIPYLWVDSLCILQDDYSDWQRQCGRMNEIYGKARVTLIAANSRTCREGFLKPTRHELRFPYKSMRRPDISGSFMMYFTHVHGETSPYLPATLDEDLHWSLTASQWARRGWTFQEDTMAGTRIVFGNSDVYFGHDNKYSSRHGPAGYVSKQLVISLQSHVDTHQAWEKVVRRYTEFTTSSFTEPSDVLPALSSLAKMFGNVLQVQYIAGHWVDRLYCSLLWNSKRARPRQSLSKIAKRHIQKPYLVPTWSCLTRGGIHYEIPEGTPGYRSEITILDVYMPTVGGDPYGAIQDACLTLQGFILDLSSLSWSESNEIWVGSVGDHPEKIWFQRNRSKPHTPQYDKIIVVDPQRMAGDLDVYHQIRLDFRLEAEDYSQSGKNRGPLDSAISQMTMVLVGSQGPLIDVLGGRQGYGLVLLPLQGASGRDFLRAGTFSPLGHALDDTLPRLKRLMKKETIRIF